MMRSLLLGGMAAMMTAAIAIAQTTPPATTQQPTAQTAQPSAPATQPPAKAVAPGPARAPTVAAADALKASTLIGLNVKNPANETVGTINDVVVDPEGKIQQVVVSVGGFLGVGTKKV